VSHASAVEEAELSHFIVDIYRIVSAKSLESSNTDIQPPSQGISMTAPEPADKGGKCC
jgi:hypothetical protein